MLVQAKVGPNPSGWSLVGLHVGLETMLFRARQARLRKMSIILTSDDVRLNDINMKFH